MNLVADDLCKRWPDGQWAIRGFSAIFEPGTITALIGRNGSGKTTVLRMLAGLLTPDSGTITGAGGRVGFLFQQSALWPHLNVREQLMLPLRLVNGNSQPHDEAERLLHEMKLTHLASRYPAELSGGQQQRVAIARCLCVNPKVILLDEITNSLDPAAQYEIALLIDDLKNRGLVVIASTHDLNWARRAATQVFYLHESIVRSHGPPEQVFVHQDDPMFAALSPLAAEAKDQR